MGVGVVYGLINGLIVEDCNITASYIRSSQIHDAPEISEESDVNLTDCR